jgi:hypothetical protein
MIKKTKWLLPLMFFAACNNNSSNKETTTGTAAEHRAHSRTAESGYCDSVNNGLIADDTLKGSPHRTAMATINGNHIHMEYNSPGVKGRVIWGGLVPYDKVWATGAHLATRIQFSKDVTINGKKIPAGQYAFFTIPGRDKWIAILNTRFDQHLADDYDEKEDVVRLELKPEEHTMTPRLTYSIIRLSDNAGEVQMDWENLRIRIPLQM